MKIKKTLIGIGIAGAVIGGGSILAVTSLSTKPVMVNEYAPSTVRDPSVKTVSCALGGTLVKNAQNQNVVEFTWTIPTGAIAYIYSPNGDVGYVPDISDTASTKKLQSLPVNKVSTYTMVVSTGTATSSCETTL